MLSKSVVLPLWKGPTSAISRGPETRLSPLFPLSAMTQASRRRAVSLARCRAPLSQCFHLLRGSARGAAPYQRDRVRCSRSVQAAAETLNLAAGILKQRVRCRIGHAEVRSRTEGRALHDRNALGFEQRIAEVFIRLDRGAVRRLASDRPRAGGKDVECAF